MTFTISVHFKLNLRCVSNNYFTKKSKFPHRTNERIKISSKEIAVEPKISKDRQRSPIGIKLRSNTVTVELKLKSKGQRNKQTNVRKLSALCGISKYNV